MFQKSIEFNVNKPVYIASHINLADSMHLQHAIILTWKTWSGALNQLNCWKLLNQLYIIQSGVADHQIACDRIQKNVNCKKLILLQSFYCLKWNMLLTRVAYLIIDTYCYFIIPIREFTDKFMREGTCTWMNCSDTLIVWVKNEILKP